MKSNLKLKRMILITLGIALALSPLFNNTINFFASNGDKNSEYGNAINLDDDNLKISKISGKIHIINNSGWVNFRNDGNCTGSGTFSDPYVIEDLVIDAGGYESCIWIEYSDVYFRIENCTVYNSRGFTHAGITLYKISNGTLMGNNASYNDRHGIYIYSSNNNTVSGNIASNNEWGGICLSGSDDNAISGNTANDNNYGIRLDESNNNTLSGNTASYNAHGIILVDSDDNTVSGNTLIGNIVCIKEENCEGNVFENNDCGGGDEEIPLVMVVIVISSIAGGIGVAGVAIVLLRKKK